MRQLEISVGEPWDFESADGPNRIVVEFVGFVRGPDKPNWQARYVLLNVPRPFTWYEKAVRTVVAGPRHVGQDIEQIVSNGGAVGVARMRPGAPISSDGAFKPEDVEYIIIGNLRPLSDGAA